MTNPTFKDGAIPRRKRPGATLLPEDSADLVENFGVHRSTPPTLADGDVAQTQMDDMGNTKVAIGDPAQVALLGDPMQIPKYDAVDYSDPTSIKFYSGGLAGTLVATLTITSTSVVKT